MDSTANTNEGNLTRNKTVVLSIPDLIALGGFLISIGVSIGVYSSAMDKLNSIEMNINNISSDVYKLRENTSSYKTALEAFDKDLDRIHNKVDK